MRQAHAFADHGDVDSAIRSYTAAIEANDRLARAHLDLALLLDGQRDYLSAIYHYQRYIALRPESEKREMIQDRILLAVRQHAASLAHPGAQTAGEAALEKENLELKEKNKGLREELSRWQDEAWSVTVETEVGARPPGQGTAGKAPRSAAVELDKYKADKAALDVENAALRDENADLKDELERLVNTPEEAVQVPASAATGEKRKGTSVVSQAKSPAGLPSPPKTAGTSATILGEPDATGTGLSSTDAPASATEVRTTVPVSPSP